MENVWLLTIFQLLLSSVIMVQSTSDMLADGVASRFKYFTIKEAAPMLEQRVACEEKGGRLAVFSPDIKDDPKNVNIDARKDVWIGLTDIPEEKAFVWFNGRKRSRFDKAKWSYLEPNNANDNEDCVFLQIRRRQMNDADCSLSFPALCQYDPNLATSKSEIFGGIFDSKLLKGKVTAKFTNAQTLVLDGQVDINPNVKEIAVFLLHHNETADSFCGSPTPIMKIYKQFYKFLKRQKTKSIFSKDVAFSGRMTVQFTIKDKTLDEDRTKYGVVIREVGKTKREVACAGVRKYSELEWFKKISHINSAVTMGEW